MTANTYLFEAMKSRCLAISPRVILLDDNETDLLPFSLVPLSLLLHKVPVVHPILLLRGVPRHDGDLPACGVTVSLLGHLEEGLDGEVVNLVDDLKGLNKVAPHPPVLTRTVLTFPRKCRAAPVLAVPLSAIPTRANQYPSAASW